MNGRFFLELLLRSTVLLLAGAALLSLCRSASAAFRHRLLLFVFVLLALLPVLSVLLPDIPVSFWNPLPVSGAFVTIQEGPGHAISQSGQAPWNWLLLTWLSGMAAASLPLAVGSISVWRTTRHAVPLQAAIKANILVSDKLAMPVTCGILRPRIVLPLSARNWSPSRMEAVLRHEAAHLRRRDLAVQISVHLVSALWWFQPLVWVLRRRLRAESEFACDAEAVRSGFRASEYARELLAVARSVSTRSVSTNGHLSSSAIGMVRQGDLEERLRAVLNPRAAVLTRSRICAVVLILGAASIAASEVVYQDSDELGGSTMKRTITSALLASAGLSAATVGGYVHDSNGAAVADARVSIYSPDSSAKQQATTGSDGKFDLSLAQGQYILRVEKSGFASIFRTFDLQSDSKLDRDFTLSAAGVATVADSPIIPPDSQPKHMRVGGEMAQSNLITKIPPTYPAAAKQARVQGLVELAVTISKEGVPTDLRVISSPSDDLSESSVEAVRQWRYRPILLNGNPVEIETVVHVNYTLSQ